MTKDLNRKLWLASALVLIATLMTILGSIRGCKGKKTTIINEGSPAPAACGESPSGEVRETQCEEGQDGLKIDICRDGEWRPVSDTCQEPATDDCEGLTLFSDIKPILTEHCLGCHFTPQKYDEYPVVKSRFSDFRNRIHLPVDNPERMPKDPRPPLDQSDKELLDKWQSDGLKDECRPGDGPDDTGFIDLDSIETAILADLSSLDEDDRLNSRYLITSHKINLGDPEENLVLFRQAIDKNLNALNFFGEDLFRTQPIKEGLYRLDLRAYALNAEDWKLVEDSDPFDLESFTDKGETLKFLSGARKPWLHFDTFGEVVGTASVYYAIMGIPDKLDDYLALVGVDIEAQLEAFTAFFVGGHGSEISLQKNRLIVRFEGNDDFPYTWITFDPIDLDGVPERNLFEFPLISGAGGTGERQFDFAASETITQSDTGLVFALWAANGERQDAAPLDIVTDTRSPLDPEINNPIDCNRCHQGGIIPMDDQIREHVQRNASEFDAEDVDIILELYRPQSSNIAIFQSDNAEYAQVANRLGFDLAKDPITFANDRLKLDWTLEELSAFVLLTPEDMAICIGRSSQGRAQIGQLTTGGTASFDQIIEVLPALKADCRLFEEPL